MEQSKKAGSTKTKGSHRHGRDFEGHRKSIHGMDMSQVAQQKLMPHVRLTPSHVHRTKTQETQTLANWWMLLFQTDSEPVVLHSMGWRITNARV